MKNPKHYDIIIAGAGLVGLTLALSLKNSGYTIGLISEKTITYNNNFNINPININDKRSLALNYKTIHFFKKLNLWSTLEPYSTPIEKIHISEKGCFGNTVLSGETAFGAVIPIDCLYTILLDTLSDPNNNSITLLHPFKITDIQFDNNVWHINHDIQTTLLLACDGDKSFIREHLKLETDKKDYHQTAMVSTVKISKPHHNIAYERFTEQGVLAMMPLQHNRAGVIWTVDNAHVNLINNNFLAMTQFSIGYRLGKLSDPGNIQTYPLQYVFAKTQTLEKFILLGNAAHVLHPVAAQGFNLSIRDIIELSNILLNTNLNINTTNIPELYYQACHAHQEEIATLTNRLLTLFKSQRFLWPALRAKGLLLFDSLDFAKHWLSQKGMGI